MNDIIFAVALQKWWWKWFVHYRLGFSNAHIWPIIAKFHENTLKIDK